MFKSAEARIEGTEMLPARYRAFFSRLGRPRTAALLATALTIALAGCERPPMDTVQHGYRGTGMVQVYNPRTVQALADATPIPEIPPPARVRPNAPKAGDTYQNVQVLRDLSIAEFGRTMDAITSWVAPEASCAYCHAADNFADDSKYTKVVARRMLQMVQSLNNDWTNHVGQVGVTCYTCHRGQPLPSQTWFAPEARNVGADFMGNRQAQNEPLPVVGLASLPNEVLSIYLMSEATSPPVRVAGSGALPVAGSAGRSIQRTEATYGLMTHLSSSLGVNCTYCHNSRAFASWAESPPQRAKAWHGLRMVREVNSEYLTPLGDTFPTVPPGRLGPGGDAAKVHCGTCHQGVYKPLYGTEMAKHFPAMLGRMATPPLNDASTPATTGATTPPTGQ